MNFSGLSAPSLCYKWMSSACMDQLMHTDVENCID